MKKALSYVLIFIVIILSYQLIVVYFANSHEVEYSLNIGDKQYTIIEKYKKDGQQDGYYLKIKIDNKEYSYYTNNYFNKQKRIIKTIKEYEEKDYLCIYPIDINQENSFEVLCSDGKETYSSNYLAGIINFENFYHEIGTKSKYIQNLNLTHDYNELTIYKNNFYDNEYLEVYRYKNLYIYNNERNFDISFSTKDIYKNNLGVFIDNYFIVPIIKYNKIVSYYLINILENKKEEIILDKNLSTNTYIIGTLNNKVYIFDLDNKVEYELSTNGKSKEIGNVEKGFVMYKNGNWEDVSITEFTNDKVTIETSISDEINYEYDEIYEVKNAYYFISDNKLYKAYKENLDNKILLHELNNYKSLQVTDDRIYYLSGEYLYRYDQYGLKTLAKSNEFNYNNTNIYYVYND